MGRLKYTKRKMDLNLENVIGIVVTLEIAKGELLYGRGICKNPEVCTWNKTYIHINKLIQ